MNMHESPYLFLVKLMWHYIMTSSSVTILVKLVSIESSCARLPLNVILWLVLPVSSEKFILFYTSEWSVCEMAGICHIHVWINPLRRSTLSITESMVFRRHQWHEAERFTAAEHRLRQWPTESLVRPVKIQKCSSGNESFEGELFSEKNRIPCHRDLWKTQHHRMIILSLHGHSDNRWNLTVSAGRMLYRIPRWEFQSPSCRCTSIFAGNCPTIFAWIIKNNLNHLLSTTSSLNW